MKTSKFAASAAIIAAMLASVAAEAATYTVGLTVGPGSVTGTIDTDGTLGVLSIANITDWDLLLNDGATTFLLDGISNSAALVFGTAFTATATGLFFDFSGTSGSDAVIFQNPFIGAGINYFCLNDALGGCSGNPSAIGLRVSNVAIGDPRQGVTLIATAGAVPEPASWALMIAGFGLTGATMRRRRTAITA